MGRPRGRARHHTVRSRFRDLSKSRPVFKKDFATPSAPARSSAPGPTIGSPEHMRPPPPMRPAPMGSPQVAAGHGIATIHGAAAALAAAAHGIATAHSTWTMESSPDAAARRIAAVDTAPAHRIVAAERRGVEKQAGEASCDPIGSEPACPHALAALRVA